jgi:hypothetical protein
MVPKIGWQLVMPRGWFMNGAGSMCEYGIGLT